MTGHHHSEETKNKISKKLKERPSVMSGRHLSEETKMKMRIARAGIQISEKLTFLGKHHDETTKEKIRMAKLGKNNPNARTIVNINTGEIFDTLKQASAAYNISTKSISNCCNGKSDSVKGYQWKYYEELFKKSMENHLGPGERLAALALAA
jgi:group I intron endonuclease